MTPTGVGKDSDTTAASTCFSVSTVTTFRRTLAENSTISVLEHACLTLPTRFNCTLDNLKKTPSCVISVNRARGTVFSLARGPVVGLKTSLFDVVCATNLSKIAACMGKDYSRVNFAMF